MSRSSRTSGELLVVSADRTVEGGVPLNLGDALLAEALAEELCDRGFRARVVDFGGQRGSGRATSRFVPGIRDFLREVRGSCGVVIGGGTLLQDDTKSGTPWRGLPRLVLVSVLAARLFRKPVAMFGVGSNPVSRSVPKAMLRGALWGTPLWVRDAYSSGLVKKQWGKRSHVAADTALLSRRLIAPDMSGLDRSGPLVVAAYAKEVTELSESSLDALREQFGSLEFISMHQGKNPDALALSQSQRELFDEVHVGLSLDDAQRVFERSQAVLSSRMHALYFGLLLGKPLATLSDRFKVQSFRQEFSIPAFTPALDSLSAPPVIEPALVNHEARDAAVARIEDSLRQLVEHLTKSQ